MSEALHFETQLARDFESPIIKTPTFTVFRERQLGDTVLTDAQVPIGFGDFYYGIHMYPIDKGLPLIKTMRDGLAAVAEGLHQYEQNWDWEDGEPPQQIVGVTHLGLARAARYAGFSCVELSEETFYEPQNERWWDATTELIIGYEEKTERGKKDDPVRFGVISQPVDSFITAWRHSDTD